MTDSAISNRPPIAKRLLERILLNNYWNIPLILLLIPLAIPVVLIIRLLRPWVLIRVDTFISHRIGHFAMNTDLYLSEQKAGIGSRSGSINGSQTLDFFFHSHPISNMQIKKMWDRTLPVIRFTQFGVVIKYLNRCFPGYQVHNLPTSDSGADRDVHNVLAYSPPNLAFLTEEEQRGERELRQMGIPEGCPFVCLHLRDSSYLKETFPDKNWEYHNYRDCNIQNYMPAMEELTRRGYFVVRMGAKVAGPLQTNNPMIIDYASTRRTDFLDIYLSAKCSFFIGCNAGLDAAPSLFRRPIVTINMIPLEYMSTWSPVLLVIPKKLRLRKEERFLTFREIMHSEIRRFISSSDYERNGLDVIENTPQEISATVIEADERLKGTWRPKPEDELLQSRFWSLYPPSNQHGQFVAKIGADFLRQHQSLLD